MKFVLCLFLGVVLTGCSTDLSSEPPVGITPTIPATKPVETKSLKKVRPYGLFGLEHWINHDPINHLDDLKGQVVLIKFWTYGCINCIRTLPHVEALQQKYADQGLVILGIHTPEFAYERLPKNVAKAVKKHNLSFPVALDNDFKTWRSFSNRYWPAYYLLDRNGEIVYWHFGEGKYEETDAIIAKVLAS